MFQPPRLATRHQAANPAISASSDETTILSSALSGQLNLNHNRAIPISFRLFHEAIISTLPQAKTPGPMSVILTPNSKAALSFTSLPREIRDSIYKFVFEAPTDPPTITLTRNYLRPAMIWREQLQREATGEEGCETPTQLPQRLRQTFHITCSKRTLPSWKLSLSILRTCQLIYAECKDLLWQYNILDLSNHPIHQWFASDRNWIGNKLDGLDALRAKVQRISLTLDCGSNNLELEMKRTEETIKVLEAWTVAGSLRELTLHLKDIRHARQRASWPLIEQGLTGILEMTAGEYMAKCRRVLRINCGSENRITDEARLSPDQTRSMFLFCQEMNKIFSGTFIWDGKEVKTVNPSPR